MRLLASGLDMEECCQRRAAPPRPLHVFPCGGCSANGHTPWLPAAYLALQHSPESCQGWMSCPSPPLMKVALPTVRASAGEQR